MTTNEDLQADGRTAPPSPRLRSGTRFGSGDPAELARRLEASDCFCRDTKLGRLYHRNDVSYREIAAADSLHVTVREDGEVTTHVDRHSPLARRQPGGDCRYSPLRIAAHNVSGAAGDLVRLALGRRKQRQGDGHESPAASGLVDDQAIHAALTLREGGGTNGATLPLAAIDVAVRRAPSGRRWTIRLEARIEGEVEPERLAGALDHVVDKGPTGPRVEAHRVSRGDGDSIVLDVEDADDDGRAALELLNEIARAYGAEPTTAPGAAYRG